MSIEAASQFIAAMATNKEYVEAACGAVTGKTGRDAAEALASAGAKYGFHFSADDALRARAACVPHLRAAGIAMPQDGSAGDAPLSAVAEQNLNDLFKSMGQIAPHVYRAVFAETFRHW